MKPVVFKKYLVLLLLFHIISCGNGNSALNEYSDRYIEDLKDRLTELNISERVIALPSEIFIPHMIEPLINRGHFLIIDQLDKKIVLINGDGDVLSSAGGEGRGPGEFEMFSQLHIGVDDRIYIHDPSQFRITVYDIIQDELIYIESISYKNPTDYQLYSIFVLESGIFGMYHYSEGFMSSPENHYSLYQLDEHLNPVKQLVDIPGNERRIRDYGSMILFAPHDYLQKTYWNIDRDKIYYSSTHDSAIHFYDFVENKYDSINLLQLQERENHHDFIETTKYLYDYHDNKEYWEVLESLKILPIFSGLWVDKGILLQSVLPFPGEDGMMIYTDLATREVKYFNIPDGIQYSAFKNNVFYGIYPDHEDSYYLIVIEMTNS